MVVQYAPYGAGANICRALGGEVNPSPSGKLGEFRVGNAATLPVATAVGGVTWGLSLTNKYLVDDIVRKPVALQHGRIQPIDQPGLGVMIDEAKVSRFEICAPLSNRSRNEHKSAARPDGAISNDHNFPLIGERTWERRLS